MTTLTRTSLAVVLYWSLPGPSQFKRELAQVLDSTQALVVRIDTSEITGIRHALREALTSACHAPERIEFVDLYEGSHLESEIGHHFGQATMSPLELANCSVVPRTTIVLTPRAGRPRERARAYLQEFRNECRGQSKKGARLVLVWHASDDPLIPEGGATIAFDGALSTDEMHAYVALRMIGRHGPGTSSLTRHLVTEFAGADAMLAEELMQLSEKDLLRLPGSLSHVIRNMNADTHQVVSSGAQRQVPINTLRDWRLSRSQEPDASAAIKRFESMYWRACVRSLLPWLEERRRPVIDLLRPALEKYLCPTKGVWKKAIFRQQRTIDIAIDDLEFNDIVAMANNYETPFMPSDVVAQSLVATCRHAKRLRDALAHLRPPAVLDIERTIFEIDVAVPPISGGVS